MNLIYYKSETGNFGDDLNPFLWNKLIPDFSEIRSDINFIGIGSILMDKFLDVEKTNLIFGSGSRNFLYRPDKKYNLDIRFVRGPLTAKSLNSKTKFITDAAYCLALEDKTMTSLKTIEKKYEVSFMPYFRHVDLLDWSLIEKFTGVHIIYPTADVNFILEELAKSERVITSAMHGAIISDVLRIPWKRVYMGEVYGESLLTTEFKWTDWLMTIEMDNTEKLSIPIYPNYSRNLMVRNIQKLNNSINVIKYFKSAQYFKFNLSKETIYKELLEKLDYELDFINSKSK